MGVFRIKENVDDFFEKDPFELFSLDAPESRPTARKSAGFWSSVFIGVLLAIIVAGGAFYALTREKRSDNETPFAYFEVRVIGPEGRPVAGAVIREGRKYLGVTDSFGEWRRFMRVRLGSSVLLDVRKESGSGVLLATKSLAIPLSHAKSGDLEIKGSVQLESMDGTGGREKKVVGIKPAPPSPGMENTSSANPTPAASSGVMSSRTSSPGPESQVEGKTAASQGPAPEFRGAEVDSGTIWFEPNSVGEAGGAGGVVIQALRQRASELGLKVTESSTWRIRLTDVDAPGARLIKIESFAGSKSDGRPLASFIRVAQDTPMQTARDLLWATTIHSVKSYQISKAGDAWRILSPSQSLWALSAGKVLVDSLGRTYPVYAAPGGEGFFLSASQGDPCSGAMSCIVTSPGVRSFPPVAGWRLLNLRVRAAIGEQLNVYVSGYEAHLKEKDLYEYWGAPEGLANISIIRGGKAIYRGRLQARPGVIPTVVVPSPPVAQVIKS
jgi:hypothetical protein